MYATVYVDAANGWDPQFSYNVNNGCHWKGPTAQMESVVLSKQSFWCICPDAWDARMSCIPTPTPHPPWLYFPFFVLFCRSFYVTEHLKLKYFRLMTYRLMDWMVSNGLHHRSLLSKIVIRASPRVTFLRSVCTPYKILNVLLFDTLWNVSLHVIQACDVYYWPVPWPFMSFPPHLAFARFLDLWI